MAWKDLKDTYPIYILTIGWKGNIHYTAMATNLLIKSAWNRKNIADWLFLKIVSSKLLQICTEWSQTCIRQSLPWVLNLKHHKTFNNWQSTRKNAQYCIIMHRCFLEVMLKLDKNYSFRNVFKNRIISENVGEATPG